MDEYTLLESVLDEGMDDWLLLDWTLVEDDVAGFELVAVVPHEAVTVTVTVAFGQLVQSCACGKGIAAARPNKDVRTTFEYILSEKRRVEKNVLKIVFW